MTETNTENTEQEKVEPVNNSVDEDYHYYRIRFRQDGQEFTIQSKLANLCPGNTVMAKTDHGPEPAIIACRAASATEPDMPRRVSYVVRFSAT